MIDTNIVIDFLAAREPFAANAKAVFGLCERGRITGIITASAMTDIYYVMRKIIGKERALENLRLLLLNFEVADVGKSDLLRVAGSEVEDLEDALVDVCAKRAKAECIITRDLNGFQNSSVPAMPPEEFLAGIQ